MSTIAPSPLLTTADLLAMPDDGVDRWLIRGQLREKPTTNRNRFHAWIESRIDYFLWTWVEAQAEPTGGVLSGEVGCILRHDPDTTVGIDVAYFSADVLARQGDGTTLVDGVPVLAVEIQSPNDTARETDDKVEGYLGAGVALVWVVNPRLRTVQVFRPDAPPTLFNVDQELTAEPHLPGFRVPVARLFTR